MHPETKTKLSKDTIGTLQELIRVNIDSRDSVREAARHVEDAHVLAVFRDLEIERNDQVSELRAIVAANAEEPEDAGTTLAAIQRMWAGLQQAIGGGLNGLLNEAERGEDFVRDSYERARRDILDTQVMDVLDRHSSAIEASHNRIRELRDRSGERS